MNKNIFKIYQFFKFKKGGYSVSPNKIFKSLNESQYWSREKMRLYQLDKLNKLLMFAGKNSDYYANRFKNIDLPLNNIDEFENKIPPIYKKEIVDNSEKIKTVKFTNKFMHSTSGSSGDPLAVYISEMAEIYRKAGSLRFRDWWGIKPHDKSVLIWRYERSKESFLLKIKTYFRSRYDINVYGLNDSNIHEYYNFIEKFKPTYIRGYKSGILEFAELIDKNKLRFKNAEFKVAVVTAEILYEEERKLIERVLNCKVANEYGSAEAGLFAYECPFGSMHIYEEANYLYVNERSEVIVTELFNESTPLINYKNDDEITITEEKCKCGRTSRLIKEVKGRVSGYISRTDGSKVNQGILISIFTELNDSRSNVVRKFKVYQKKNKLKIKIVPMDNFNNECKDFICKSLYEHVGNDILIEFDIVSKIEREKSGKLVYFVNEQ
jgi:phenylacetate-CoA ligase